MNPAFRWSVFGQWGSLTCGLEVMTTSSSQHGRKGDLSLTVVPDQLLTMAETPGSKTTTGIQHAQISLQVRVCVGVYVCVCVFSCDKALSCFCDLLVSLCGLGVIGLKYMWNPPSRFVHFCHKLKLKKQNQKNVRLLHSEYVDYSYFRYPIRLVKSFCKQMVLIPC